MCCHARRECGAEVRHIDLLIQLLPVASFARLAAISERMGSEMGQIAMSGQRRLSVVYVRDCSAVGWH